MNLLALELSILRVRWDSQKGLADRGRGKVMEVWSSGLCSEWCGWADSEWAQATTVEVFNVMLQSIHITEWKDKPSSTVK